MITACVILHNICLRGLFENYLDIYSYFLGGKDKSLKFHQNLHQDRVHQCKKFIVHSMIESFLVSWPNCHRPVTRRNRKLTATSFWRFLLILCFKNLTNKGKLELILHFSSFVYILRCQHSHIPSILVFVKKNRVISNWKSNYCEMSPTVILCTYFRTVYIRKSVKSTWYLVTLSEF